MIDRSKSLRSRLVKGAALLVPGASNAVTARIIEDLGFPAAYVTGAGVANSFLGAPDIGLLTLTELAEHVAAIRENTELPLIVDADTGFGNAVSMTRTVKVLERAGAGAIQIEDQQFPKRCGHFSGKAVIATAEMVNKIKAAADTRQNGDFLIIARTDALASNGIEDALDRAGRFAEAGADLTFVEAPRSREQMQRITATLPVPQVINIVSGGLTPMLGVDEFAGMGFAMVLYANAALQAAMLATRQILNHLQRTGSLDGAAHLLMDFPERQRIVGKPHFDALENRYRDSDN